MCYKCAMFVFSNDFVNLVGSTVGPPYVKAISCLFRIKLVSQLGWIMKFRGNHDNDLSRRIICTYTPEVQWGT